MKGQLINQVIGILDSSTAFINYAVIGAKSTKSLFVVVTSAW